MKIAYQLVLIIIISATTFELLSFSKAMSVQAATRPIVISKTMRNITLGATYNNQPVATVTSDQDTVRVNLVISIPGDAINTNVSIIDVFAEKEKRWTFTSTKVGLSAGGLDDSGNCEGVQRFVDAPALQNERTFQIASAANPLVARSQYCIQYEGQPQSAIFPNYKSRLVGHPVFVVDAVTPKSLADIAYLYYIPQINNTPSLTSSLYGKSREALDLGVLVPGVSVNIANTDGSNAKDITSPPVFVLRPNPDELITTDTTAKQCEVTLSLVAERSRGGACLYATQATITDSISALELGSARAYFMTLPSSTIVGNVYSGSGLDANNLLLPGQHSAGSSAGGTSLSKENIKYDIASNAVNGWDTNSVYKNVYQNANINRLKRSPDLVIDTKSRCDELNIESYVITSCVVNSAGKLRVRMQNTSDLDLSSADLDRSTAVSARKNDFVVHIKGDLVLGRIGSLSIIEIKNLVGGTIIVDGKLYINNVNIVQDSNAASLGFIVLSDDPNEAVNWENNTNSSSTLNKVVFFAPISKFIVIKDATDKKGTMKLIGSIVANKVDMSRVKAVVDLDAADKSGITVEYDQSIANSPPPGFQLFSSTPILKDLAP